MEIIIKDFKSHYNVALGKVVTSQRQYNEEIKRGGYIPYEQAQEQTAATLAKRNEFHISKDAQDWMRDVKSSSDRKGNVKLSDRQIAAMKERGTMTNRENPALKAAQQDADRRLPECYRGK